MSGFVNDIMVAENVDFRNVKPAVGQMTTDGDLLIGSTATPNIKKGVLTSPDSSITIGYSSPNITLVANGSTTGQTITGDDLVPLSPLAGNWNIVGDGLTTSGSGNTLTISSQSAQQSSSVLIGAGISLTTATPKTITSITLPAGNWNISATGEVSSATSSISILTTSISTTTDVLGGNEGQTDFTERVDSLGHKFTVAVPNYQVSVAIPTTFYLVLKATFGNPTIGFGTISAIGQLSSGSQLSLPILVSQGGTGITSTTANQLLYSSATSVIGGLATANNSVLVTNSTGVPSLGTSLSNDFTYTSSTAGATRTLTVSNTDNTNSASKALFQATTGGTSSGDPFQTFTVSGTTNWSQGIDNSVTGDPFVLAASTALGTTNVMSATTAGEINYPLQPAFSAYNSATDSNATGDGTTFTVIFDTEIFDQNSDYNNTTGIFTAPVTGTYLFTAGVGYGDLAAGVTFSDIIFVINSGNKNIFNGNMGAIRSSTNNLVLSGSTIVRLTANDTCKVTTSVTGITKVVDILGDAGTLTFFSGYLLC